MIALVRATAHTELIRTRVGSPFTWRKLELVPPDACPLHGSMQSNGPPVKPKFPEIVLVARQLPAPPIGVMSHHGGSADWSVCTSITQEKPTSSVMPPGGTNDTYMTSAPVLILQAKFLEVSAPAPPKQLAHCSEIPAVADWANVVRGRTTETAATAMNRGTQRFMIASLSLGER